MNGDDQPDGRAGARTHAGSTKPTWSTDGRRGQAHTLEAVAAAMLLLSSIVFALQVTAVTPLSGSTSSQHIENQQAAVAEGILSSAAANGTLKPTLLFWNGSADRFYGAARNGYHSGGPPTAFGSLLNRSLRARSIAFNVNVYYVPEDGGRERKRLVYLGAPSDHASTANRLVTLYDGDRLRNETGAPVGPALGNASSQFYAPDRDPDGPLFQVLEVEVVVWRM